MQTITRRALYLGLGLFLMGASAPSAQDWAGAYGAGAMADALRPQPAVQHLLFGGRNHDVFLGCLNCTALEPKAVCNPYGRFGNPFSSDSIWQPFAVYGNRLSGVSPWNEVAADPPAIVDAAGNFYGYFTAKQTHPKRTKVPVYQVLTEAAAKGTDLDVIRKAYCRE